MKPKSLGRVGVVLGVGTAAVGSSVLALKAWQRRLNATDEETARPLPFDDQVSQPTYVTNRAITVAAAPEQIWPWIAQMGELPRGGFYSYLTIERLLKMKVANADRVLPGFQTLEVGMAIDRAGTMVVKAVEPNSVLVLGPPPMPDFDSTWAIALLPAGDGSTRLLSRCRARLPRGAKGLLMLLILDPGQFLMERKMLLEIKKRAEEHPLPEPAQEPLPEVVATDPAPVEQQLVS
jgi:hypothetical protein